MKYLVISFKSRNELYSFARVLKLNGIYSSIITTPKSIGSTCMLSIKTDFKNLNTISNLIRQHNPKSFLGLFSIQQSTNGQQIFKIM